MTRSQVRAFVDGSALEKVRETLDALQRLKNHAPESSFAAEELRFLQDLLDHEAFFRSLADHKLQAGKQR
ncbi:MAG: hypothetical protein JO035_03860 [Betaproteobacteria bacterium]|nr:hypothetical protein [Betaproteobacteria bacterium]